MSTFSDRAPRSILVPVLLVIALAAGFGLGMGVQHRRTISIALADIKSIHGKCNRDALSDIGMEAACHREEDSKADSARIMRILK